MKDEKLTEVTTKSELIYDGAVVHLYRDEIRLPDGKPGVREIVRHIGAVSVIPLDADGNIICVRQFRYPYGKVLTEIPAGKLDSPDEIPEEAARRELREEVGAVGGRLIPLGDLYPSVAIFNEVIHMYAAVGFSYGETDPDEDEFLDVVRIPFGELYRAVLDGEITDAKTQVSVLKLQKLIEDKKIII